jgi:hypothetical protein
MFAMTVQNYGYGGCAALGGVSYGFDGYIEKATGHFTHELCDAKQLECIVLPTRPDDPLTSGQLEGERVSGMFKGNRSFSATRIVWPE